jgi:hypothetical protein
MATQLLKTVKPSGGDYTSLEACMDANEQNLVTADKYFDVEIDGTWSSADTSAVTIHNYTTDATRYINIYTTSAARHNGTWSNSTCYCLTSSTASVHALNFSGINNDTGKISITGLCFDISAQSGGSPSAYCIRSGSYKSSVTIAKNIFKLGSAYALRGIDASNSRGSAWYIYDNIAFGGTGTYGALAEIGGGNNANLNFYNNTAYNCTYGLRITSNNSKQVLTNNLMMNCGTACFSGTAASGSNNASSDATASNSPFTSGVINKTSYTDYFVSVTGGSEDFHLKSTATDFIDAGADLSATFSDDIIGTFRPQGSAWDIGAFEYVAQGGGTARVRGYMTTNRMW